MKEQFSDNTLRNPSFFMFDFTDFTVYTTVHIYSTVYSLRWDEISSFLRVNKQGHIGA